MSKLSVIKSLVAIVAMTAPLLLGGCIVQPAGGYYRQTYAAPAPAPAYVEPAPVYYAPAPAYYAGPTVVFGGYGGRRWR